MASSTSSRVVDPVKRKFAEAGKSQSGSALSGSGGRSGTHVAEIDQGTREGRKNVSVLTSSNSGHDPCIRPFVEEDVSQVANLWWTFHRRSKRPAPSEVLTYFQDLYFRNPCIDNTIPSLVYQDAQGAIVGFLGLIRRKMSFRGQSIRTVLGGNFVVRRDARNTPAALRLLDAYRAGGQDLSLSDSANNTSRALMEQLGFKTIAPFSVHWARPLRPAHYAAHALSLVKNPVLSAAVRGVTLPFYRLLDFAASKVSSNPFRQAEPRLNGTDLDVETFLQCMTQFRDGSAIWPEYDVESLTWLLGFMEKMHPHSELRKIVLRDEHGQIVGWYLYYLKAGSIGQVVQVGGPRRFVKDVLDHLFYDAWQGGAIAVHGVVRSDLMPDYWEKKCFFTCRSGWALAHSHDPELVELLNRGDALLSRLDGEWCLGYER